MNALKEKRAAPARTTRDSTTDNADDTEAERAAQVARIRRRAHSFDYSAVFVSDAPIVAELYDTRGNLAECWEAR
jgi:hypothetical protein